MHPTDIAPTLTRGAVAGMIGGAAMAMFAMTAAVGLIIHMLTGAACGWARRSSCEPYLGECSDRPNRARSDTLETEPRALSEVDV